MDATHTSQGASAVSVAGFEGIELAAKSAPYALAVLAYLVLAVDSVDGADLNAASVAKFNAVSAKHGFPERIGAA